MKSVPLTSLRPFWLNDGGPRSGMVFNCPCGCERAIVVTWSGSGKKAHQHWQRFGERFYDMTLVPGIDAADTDLGRKKGCTFNGQIVNGEVQWELNKPTTPQPTI